MVAGFFGALRLGDDIDKEDTGLGRCRSVSESAALPNIVDELILGRLQRLDVTMADTGEGDDEGETEDDSIPSPPNADF